MIDFFSYFLILIFEDWWSFMKIKTVTSMNTAMGDCSIKWTSRAKEKNCQTNRLFISNHECITVWHSSLWIYCIIFCYFGTHAILNTYLTVCLVSNNRRYFYGDTIHSAVNVYQSSFTAICFPEISSGKIENGNSRYNCLRMSDVCTVCTINFGVDKKYNSRTGDARKWGGSVWAYLLFHPLRHHIC